MIPKNLPRDSSLSSSGVLGEAKPTISLAIHPN
jgi:hypothetical protein